MNASISMIAATRALLPGGCWSGPVTVSLAGGRIATVTEGVSPGAEVLTGGVLTPGLIDLHNNGAFGIDFAEADEAGWCLALDGLARRGVTAVQPTAITAPMPRLKRVLRQAAALGERPASGARMLGVHLEGPFLSPAFRGAHRAEWLQDPYPDAIRTLLDDPALRTVTLAPERPGGLDAIRRLVDAGIVVALGHSDATAAQAHAAADAGATAVTHLFNAMRPFRHRDPGLPGAALVDDRLRCGLIVDGLHVDPLACRIAFAAKGAGIVAVTDSILIAGTTPGTSLAFGGAPVTADVDGLGRRTDGTISGAGIVLDEGVRRMIAAGIDPAIIMVATTETPAQAIGRDDLGRLAAGAQADLVWWDEKWVPRRVWIAGEALAL